MYNFLAVINGMTIGRFILTQYGGFWCAIYIILSSLIMTYFQVKNNK